MLPSVVTVSASSGSASQIGSGEIIDSDGHILTNNHVVGLAAGGGTIHVLLSNGVSLVASLQGRDVQTDLAVLKVEHDRGAAGRRDGIVRVRRDR